MISRFCNFIATCQIEAISKRYESLQWFGSSSTPIVYTDHRGQTSPKYTDGGQTRAVPGHIV